MRAAVLMTMTVLLACGDDDRGVLDAGPRDAGGGVLDAGTTDAGTDAGSESTDAGPDAAAAADAATAADAGPDAGSATDAGPDAGPLDDPCRLPENWSCPLEGGGDCRAFCGDYSVEIFSTSREAVCFTPSGERTCDFPTVSNCAGCEVLWESSCCFE